MSLNTKSAKWHELPAVVYLVSAGMRGLMKMSHRQVLQDVQRWKVNG